MSAAFHHYSNKTYRQDIQGVRAIGALLIMVYHLWLDKVSGGVDVFFVVSGYFMGSVLLGQLNRSGTVQPLKFWGSIIQRVAPSAYTVLVATVVLAYVFIPESQWIRLINEVLASAIHAENLYLMQTAVDYLSKDDPASAVQQFWALSIQIQFYLLLPLVVWLAALLSNRMQSVAPLIGAVLAVILLSLAYSIYVTSQAPLSAYFNPAARVWEFFTGVLIATLMPHLQLRQPLREVLGAVGLVALLTGGLLLPGSVHFPGYVALVPVAAATSLLIAGGGPAKTWTERLLSQRVFSFLGGISFTIYLWHWPLRVFYQQATGRSEIGLVAGLAIIAGAIGLAYLTTRWLEVRVKATRRSKRPLLVPFVIGAAFALPAMALAVGIKLHFKVVVDGQAKAVSAQFPGSGLDPQRDAKTVSYAQFLSAKKLLPKPYLESCQQNPASPEIRACAYGDKNSATVVALVGGSHATQWLPAMDEIGQKQGIKVLNITKSLCPYGALSDSHPSCLEWNKRLTQYLIDIKPAAVITNSTRTSKLNNREHVPQSYVDQWRALSDHGIDVVGIRDNPQYVFDPVDCLARNKSNALVCTKTRTEAMAAHDPAERFLDDVSTLRLVDMTDYLCSVDLCPTLFNNLLIYSDPEHISVGYVRFIQTKLAEQLNRAVPDVFDSEPRLGGPR